MIAVDSRAGSKDLIKPLLAAGMPVSSETLLYGDLAFEGRGPDSTTLSVGIEFKMLGDMIASIRSGRFTGPREAGTLGQLHGMVASYDHAWLMVEGYWRTDDRGRIVAYQGPKKGWTPVPGGMGGAELDKHLLTFEVCAGIHVWRTTSRADTIRAIASLYRWHSDSAIDRHTSHLAPHRPQTLTPLSPFRAAVMAWPGVGLQASLAAELQFGASVTTAAMAMRQEWAELQMPDPSGKPRRFGEAKAEKLMRFLRGDAA